MELSHKTRYVTIKIWGDIIQRINCSFCHFQMLSFVIFPLFLLQLNADPQNQNQNQRQNRQLFFSLPNQYEGQNYQQAALVPLNLGDISHANSPLFAFWSQLSQPGQNQPFHYSNQPLPETQASPFESSQFLLNQNQNQKNSNAFSYYFLPIQAMPKSTEVQPQQSGGFNRGSIEFSNKNQQQQQQYKKNGGFVREHLENRPRPVVTSNKNAFNRGAVEGHGGPLR